MSYSSDPVIDADRETCRRERWTSKLDQARIFAKALITGGDTERTADLLSNFFAGMTDERTSLLCPSPFLRGPMSLVGVTNVLLTANDTNQLAAAARELQARYFNDEYTDKTVERLAEHFSEEL